MGKNISSLGGLVAFIGIVSSVLYFVGWNHRALIWVDQWGPAVGWLIRGGLIVAGAALFFIFGGGGDDDEKKKKKKKKKE